ncbi:DBH-like monooxygenase [Trema orientale]|uniref:DBH-like monooxygenase n=1 Tax=Trema orientale TaxID=63057 RepID=A0A2P5E718_TREOI|nr:DBH-like monooxygenase [Trema orientale]
MGAMIRAAKLKRKEAEDLHQVSHDFSDFSLSSPARKIRRLDAELPPILEEEEPEVISFPSSMATGRGPLIEELDSVPDPLPIHNHRDPHPHDDKDKAIVLFKPLNSPIFHNSPNISLSLDSNFISGFKDRLIRGPSNQKKTSNGDDIAAGNECLAVVPWVPPSQLIPPTEASQIPAEAPLESMEEDAMEIEDDSNRTAPQLVQQGYDSYAGMSGAGEGIPQWYQQHCMVPQPPHNTSTPITWFQ